MYRVTAEAVSGTNVYADGKWLKCIGNKPVHVGERVWTDGRCVYGNYQESQQPPVIIPQVEEEIPIATDNGYFIFSKRKLKPCKSEKPLTNYKFFINNKQSNCYFVENYSRPQTNPSEDPAYVYYAYEARPTSQYGETIPLTVRDNDYSCEFKGTFAADVDLNGNLFAIVIDQFNLNIIKNTKIVATVDLKDLTQKATKLVSMPSSPAPKSEWGHYDGDPTASGDWVIFYVYTISTDLQVNYAFIENENNWNVYIEFFVRKIAMTTHGDWPERLLNISDASINCYLSNHGTKINIGREKSSTSTFIKGYGYIPQFDSEWGTTPDPDYKLALQDGYYFTEKREGNNVQIVIYSPKGQQIFSDYFAFGSIIFGFSKVKGGFLLNIYDAESKKNKLYFLAQNRVLLTEYVCHNAKFRPIKKNKRNWQNQIETIAFDS